MSDEAPTAPTKKVKLLLVYKGHVDIVPSKQKRGKREVTITEGQEFLEIVDGKLTASSLIYTSLVSGRPGTVYSVEADRSEERCAIARSTITYVDHLSHYKLDVSEYARGLGVEPYDDQRKAVVILWQEQETARIRQAEIKAAEKSGKQLDVLREQCAPLHEVYWHLTTFERQAFLLRVITMITHGPPKKEKKS